MRPASFLPFVHPFRSESRTATKFLLQASVVGLGFGMNLHQVLRARRSGFVYTALNIAFVMTAGLLAGRYLGVNKTASTVITVVSAICGGSAIAAVAPAIHADQEETAVSLGTVFILFHRTIDISTFGLVVASFTAAIWTFGRRWPFTAQARRWVQPRAIERLRSWWERR
jgi:uncharacterized membrane protein YadS